MTAATPPLVPNQVVLIPVDQLLADAGQPRTEFDETALKALATDIGARGIDLPILIRADYVIKDGERRWRAAKRAGLKAVPCLLAADVPEENGAVEWQLDQVADNHHREPLGPLDWSRFLKKLVETPPAGHGVAVKDLPALLAKRGIAMSRSYCSNLMRLLDLPAWAQDLIVAGPLTAAHGKHILTANVSPKALTHLHHQIKEWLDHDYHGPLTTIDLQGLVVDAFDETHIQLDATVGETAPRFNVKTCEACPNRKVIGNASGSRDRVFCLDAPCFEKKQQAADESAATKTGGGKINATAAHPEKRKLDPREATRRRKERARTMARERALVQITEKTKRGLGSTDRRLIAKAFVRELQHNTLKEIFTRRGWKPKRLAYGSDYMPVADHEIDKMGGDALDGFFMECALSGNLNVGYYSRGTDFLAETGKRYGIDLAALEKTALAEITPKKTKAKKPAAAKKPKSGICQVCGCTDTTPCDVGIEGACAWVDKTHTLCSNPACVKAAKKPTKTKKKPRA